MKRTWLDMETLAEALVDAAEVDRIGFSDDIIVVE